MSSGFFSVVLNSKISNLVQDRGFLLSRDLLQLIHHNDYNLPSTQKSHMKDPQKLVQSMWMKAVEMFYNFRCPNARCIASNWFTDVHHKSTINWL